MKRSTPDGFPELFRLQAWKAAAKRWGSYPAVKMRIRAISGAVKEMYHAAVAAMGPSPTPSAAAAGSSADDGSGVAVPASTNLDSLSISQLKKEMARLNVSAEGCFEKCDLVAKLQAAKANLASSQQADPSPGAPDVRLRAAVCRHNAARHTPASFETLRPEVGEDGVPADHKQCDHCQMWFAKVQHCTACHTAAYCGKACQKAAWHAGHKKACKEAAKAAAAAAAARPSSAAASKGSRK